MNPALIGGVLSIGEKLISRFVPDKAEQAKARLELFEAAQRGELKELEISMAAILAEANSADPWTSRARPSFLYVIYILILSAIPMGFLSAFEPEIAAAVAAGFRAWLQAIPAELYALFGAGYLGYTHYRSRDKADIMKGRS